jgi:CheY-like chemotaxis protein
MAFRMPRRILVVEDTAELKQLFERVLRNAGFEVIAASTNSEAMEILEKFHPDLLLTDCFLSGAGPLLVQVLKQSRPELPIIVLSDDPVVARMALPDADAVLAKHTQAIAKVGDKILNGRPLPHFATALLNQSYIPKFAPRRVCCCLSRHPGRDQFLDLFFEVFPNLF